MSTAANPGRLSKLTTTTSYETSGYRRRISRTLPGANSAIYEYYATSAGATVNVACTTVDDTTIDQGGRLRKTTDPTAATGKAIITETVYDIWGRTVATRYGTRTGTTDTWDSTWTCTTFDARGRPTTTSVPARATQPARTVTNNYAVSGDPRVTAITDSAGTITATADLLGRGLQTVDVWAQTSTSSYDQTTGRLTSTSGPSGLQEFSYDRAGRLTQQKLDSKVVAIPSYLAPGSANEFALGSVSYPSGTGNGGNGTSGAFTYNSNGHSNGITWTQSNATLLTASAVTRSQSGRIIDNTIDGTDPYTTGNNYTYDSAGRLITARASGHTYTYAFAATAGCGANTAAGVNSNRTSYTDNSVTVATYCYDQADRLTSYSTDTPVYDNYGNTTGIAGQQLVYDGADRHVATYAPTQASPTTSVVYTRDVTDNIVARTATVGTTISHRASSSASTGAATATAITVTKPVGTATGDVMIAGVTVEGGGTNVTISAPTGWTQITTRTNTTATRTSAFWKAATASEPASYDFTLSNARKGIAGISAYTGVDTTTPVDAFAGNNPGNSLSVVGPSVTTTGTNRQLVIIYGIGTGTTVTPAADATERVDVTGSGTGARTMAIHDRPVAAAGATGTTTATIGVSAHSANISVALQPATGAAATTVDHYSGGAVLDATNTTITERTITLPGGVLLTKRPSGDVWSYPNIHGDTQATANPAGIKQGTTLTYDPYGQPLTGTVDNHTGNIDNAWLGQHTRPYEHETGLTPLIEMGARPYGPTLGRFLQIDPIEGGTTTNDYGYVRDPVNQSDLDGRGGGGGIHNQCHGATTSKKKKAKCQAANRAHLDQLKKGVPSVSVQVCPGLCFQIGVTGLHPVLGVGGYGWGTTVNVGQSSKSSCRRSKTNVWIGFAAPFGGYAAQGTVGEHLGRNDYEVGASFGIKVPIAGGVMTTWTLFC